MYIFTLVFSYRNNWFSDKTNNRKVVFIFAIHTQLPLDQVGPRSLRPLHFNFYNFSLFERHPRFDDKLLALLAGGSDKNLIS